MRYKIVIEYDGTGFVGFQRQENGLSIQQVIEDAIFSLSGKDVKIFASGRTDAGVHALGQVAHFDLDKFFSENVIVGALNFYLKKFSVVILSAEIVSDQFHARFSARQRKYIYRIINRKAPLAIEKNRALHVKHMLNIDNMQKAADHLIGTHDFTSFRSSQCQANSPVKTLDEIKIVQDLETLTIEVTALSFLHHMIRNISGTLIKVGIGKLSPDQIPEILKSKNRSNAGPTAPPYALYFAHVKY